MTSYRLSEHQMVIEFREVVDIDNESAAELDLRRLILGGGVRSVIIDIRTPLVTAALLNILLRLRQDARPRGIALAVAAREPLARKVFKVTGLTRVLQVAATLTGAQALVRGCPPEISASSLRAVSGEHSASAATSSARAADRRAPDEHP